MLTTSSMQFVVKKALQSIVFFFLIQENAYSQAFIGANIGYDYSNLFKNVQNNSTPVFTNRRFRGSNSAMSFPEVGVHHLAVAFRVGYAFNNSRLSFVNDIALTHAGAQSEGNQEEKITMSYLMLNPCLRFRTADFDVMHVYLGVGLAMNFLMNSNQKLTNAAIETYTYDNDKQVYNVKYVTSEGSINSYLNGFALGFSTSMGLSIPAGIGNLEFEVKGNFGLTNVFETLPKETTFESSSLKALNVYFTAGYVFPIEKLKSKSKF